MPRPQQHDRIPVQPFVPSRPRTLYRVLRRGDAWLIDFNGHEYGPYQTEREAILFAVDAANTLGQQGEETQVVILDEVGDEKGTWTYGQDAFPPSF